MRPDSELRLELAKMLPDKIGVEHHKFGEPEFYWKQATLQNEILNTEWLHVCWLVEQALGDGELCDYGCELVRIVKPYIECEDDVHWGRLCNASWEQRAKALIKAKGKP